MLPLLPQQLYTLRVTVYLWLESRAEITNVLYRMDSAIVVPLQLQRHRWNRHLFWFGVRRA